LWRCDLWNHQRVGCFCVPMRYRLRIEVEP
jgi:hypothetical protein